MENIRKQEDIIRFRELFKTNRLEQEEHEQAEAMVKEANRVTLPDGPDWTFGVLDICREIARVAKHYQTPALRT